MFERNGMGSLCTSSLGIAVSLLFFGLGVFPAELASGAEMEWLPVDASVPHTISGHNITLVAAPGATVTLEFFLSGWAPAHVRGYLFQLDSSGYSSGSGSPLGPLGGCCPGNPNGAFVDTNRPDWVFAGLTAIGTLDISSLDYRWAGSAMPPLFAMDPGTLRYGGTLIIDIPSGAAGTYAIGALLSPTQTFMLDENAIAIPFGFTSATITIFDPIGPLAGNCCVAHDTPGCFDEFGCGATVIAADLFCGVDHWNAQCVAEAEALCAMCPIFPSCAAGAGQFSCCGAHNGPGCNDDRLGCCTIVCGIDTFCCSVQWDESCAEKAEVHCPSCRTECGSGSGDCLVNNGTPGCDDTLATGIPTGCCSLICEIDPSCCDATWNDSCASKAALFCPEFGGCCGDVDRNGVVTLADVLQIILAFKGLIPERTGDISPCLGGDGVASISDALCAVLEFQSGCPGSCWVP